MGNPLPTPAVLAPSDTQLDALGCVASLPAIVGLDPAEVGLDPAQDDLAAQVTDFGAVSLDLAASIKRGLA